MAEPSVVAPGGTLTLSSTGLGDCGGYGDPVEYVALLGLQGREPPKGLGVITVAPDGTFSTSFTVPPAVGPGPAGITITGSVWDDCDDSSSCAGYGTQILVTAPEGPGPGPVSSDPPTGP